MKITHAGLLMCSDCTAIIANGELGQGDADADHQHALKMAARWGEHTLNLVLAGDDTDVIDFSTRRCAGCGSDLAGTRHPAVCLG